MYAAAAQINWIAVIAAFFAYFALGALWFALLFPRQYRKSLGLTDSAEQSRAAIFYVGPAICTFLVVAVSAILMKALGVASYGEALLFGAAIGVGYLVATTVNTAINPVFKRPLLYGLVSGSYHLVGILLVSVILVALQ